VSSPCPLWAKALFQEKNPHLKKLLIFTSNHANMKLLKLTALFLALSGFILTNFSCEKENDERRRYEYVKENLVMNGAQSVPTSPSTATGKLSVYYNKRAKTLYYALNWSGLTGNVTSIGIHGVAPEGYAALTPAGGLAPALHSVSGTGLGTSGTYVSSVILDEAVLKEQTLLNQLYYVRINTAAVPTGEIRAQIKFQ
jgi:hypothetical protein